MILKDKDLNALIESCEKKSKDAYRNYQDTGHGRYWNTHRKYEDLADTLKVARDGEKRYQQCGFIISELKQWARTISQMPYYIKERKEQEIINILNAIVSNAELLSR